LEKSVIIDVGNEARDIYDAVSNTILKTAATGETSVVIPADAAIIAVIIPAGSTITYDLNKALVNDVVIDYSSGLTVTNNPPRIKSLSSEKQIVVSGDSSYIYCSAVDINNDPVNYHWSVNGGTISGTGYMIKWSAPLIPGKYSVVCTVSDSNGGVITDTLTIDVVEFINSDPVIEQIKAYPRKIHPGTNTTINCIASDSDRDPLYYDWSAAYGILSGSGTSVTWTAPNNAGNFNILCSVNDGRGGEALDSIRVSVRDTTIIQTGDLTAFYPFNGNADDMSGFNNNGTVSGALLTSDRWGNTAGAYSFDGINDNIAVTSSPGLNFQNGVTINFWIKVGEFYDRESYPLSHGNWENRWKVSITNKHIRWTVKTDAGTKDLDSETELVKNILYNVTVLYDGNDYEIYIKGELDAFTSFSGLIETTLIDLLIGQVLPANMLYNFKGVLDDIRIYNYALSYSSIQSLYDFITDVKNEQEIKPPKSFGLMQNFPNPFNPETTIEYSVPESSLQGGARGGFISLKVFNIIGQEVATLVNEVKTPGNYKVTFDGSKLVSGIYLYRIDSADYSNTKKMVLLK
jgi:hypothetical protein